MEERKFIKIWSGLSDFILFPNWKPQLSPEIYTKLSKLCQREFGIGGRGIILFSATTPQPQIQVYSPISSNPMEAMFGAAKYALDLGIYPIDSLELDWNGRNFKVKPLDQGSFQWLIPLDFQASVQRKTVHLNTDNEIQGWIDQKNNFLTTLPSNSRLSTKKRIQLIKKALKSEYHSSTGQIAILRSLSSDSIELIMESPNADKIDFISSFAKVLCETPWLESPITIVHREGAMILSCEGSRLAITAQSAFLFEGNIFI